MYDYGNARIAGFRSRLLDRSAWRRLDEAESAAAFLAVLERADDWRPILRESDPRDVDPPVSIERSIERHRSARLGALPPLYPPPARRLVEALVLPLDHERVMGIVRRRVGGEPPETVASGLLAGALLDSTTLAELARAPSLASLLRGLVAAGLLLPEDALGGVAGSGAGFGGGIDQRNLEERLWVALERGRRERAAGRGADASKVRELLDREDADRRAVASELMPAGPTAASLLERTTTLARLDDRARAGRRDPLGIGTVAGYVAAVEAQAIRLRASLAHVVAGWGRELVGLYVVSGRV